MAEITDLKEKSMLEEGLSPRGDSGKGPKMEELKTLKKEEVEKLQLKKVETERLQVKEEVSWTLKSAKVEVRLAEVVEWLLADPQVLKHCNALFLSSSVTENLAKCSTGTFGNLEKLHRASKMRLSGHLCSYSIHPESFAL